MKHMTFDDTLRASYLGYVTQAIINNFAPLLFLIFRDELGIPLQQITFLIMANFLVQLTVDVLAIQFVDRIGYKICITAAHLFAGAGMIGLAVFPLLIDNKLMALLLAVTLYAIGGGLIEVLISPIVEACPTENKSSSMSLLHSFYCWGTVAVVVFSTLFLHAFGTSSWLYLAGIWASLAFANALYFTQVPIAQLTEKNESTPLKQLLSMKTFWLFILLMIAAGASEQAMIQWASAFAESGLGISKTMGDLLGPTMFAVLMGVSRVFYAKYSESINLMSFIIGSGILCVFSYLLAAFAPGPSLSLIGCALCGLSVGILWPGVFSIASANFPKGGTALFALLAVAGDIGCAIGPTVVGRVSGLFNNNLKYGFVVAMIFPLILVGCSLIYKYRATVRQMVIKT